MAKKEKFEPEIPDWELKSGFDPLSVKLRKQSDILLVNYKGEITQPSDCLPSAEEVVNGSDYDFEDLSFLDPNFFKAGNLMYCSEQWEKIGCPGEILDWIKQGILGPCLNILREILGVVVTIQVFPNLLIFKILLVAKDLRNFCVTLY